MQLHEDIADKRSLLQGMLDPLFDPAATNNGNQRPMLSSPLSPECNKGFNVPELPDRAPGAIANGAENLPSSSTTLTVTRSFEISSSVPETVADRS